MSFCHYTKVTVNGRQHNVVCFEFLSSGYCCVIYSFNKYECYSQAGLHKLELNPYWKDGGTGLPPEETAQTAVKKGKNHHHHQGMFAMQKAEYENSVAVFLFFK